MAHDIEKMAAELARSEAVADGLEQLLPHPDDRAYVQCSHRDCQHNLRGRCSIYTVTALNAMNPNKPCAEFKLRQ